MTEFPSLKLPDALIEHMKKQPLEFWQKSKEWSDSIEGVAPLVGPLKVTQMTFRTVDGTGKVLSCIGIPCEKERCTCGYYG